MDSSPSPVIESSKGWRVHKERGADIIGELVAGRHRILRRIAKGGMADVFLAKDMVRKAPVAIKILRSRGSEAKRRFKVEGEILSNLQHAGIVRAVDRGELDGQPYMALEYIKGEPLSSRLARGPLPWREVVALGIQAADAVHTLHLAGIVHRDLKPDNIMITTDERPAAKLIDLGLASVGREFHDAQDVWFTPDPPARHQTLLGHPIGTPPYLPPEAGHCPAEPRLDVYSLATTLYQLCTQLLPQDTGGRAIRDVCPGSDAPDDLSRLLQAALAPDVAERLPSADHLRRGLEAILAAHPVGGSRDLFGGSYDLLEVLGVGASAVVYRASDRELSREVAVKVMRDRATSDDDVIRFRRASKVLSALDHPNIPTIHHHGTHAGQRFVVTALCTGKPATIYARPDNHLRVDELLAIGVQLAGALAAVHAAGIVYRDLHPGNVLIARGDEPRAWIFDFDQAQVSPGFYAALPERWATPPEERREPRREKRLQTMDYASPEVRGGAAFTTASDVYALGLLLYRLLTGRRPVSALGELVPPRKFCRCPLGLEGLILMMLEPGPDKRPTMAGVLLALKDEQEEFAAENEPQAAAIVDPPEAATAKPAAAAVEVADDPGTAPVPEAAPVAPVDAAAAPVAHEEATAAPAAPADTVIAEPDAALVSTTDGAALTTTADVGAAAMSERRGVPQAPAQRRAPGWWALGLTAALWLVIGRATGPREQDERDASAPARPPHEASEHAGGSVSDERAESLAGDAPAESPSVPPPAADTPAASGVPPAELPSVLRPANDTASARSPAPPSKQAGPRAPRRETLSQAEAEAAAEKAVPSLRYCKEVPNSVTAELDIARGHGTVTSLNLRAPASDDPRYPWHGCARRALEGVRYPVSITPGHVQVRLTLR
jgi:serine/threonine protein kinase